MIKKFFAVFIIIGFFFLGSTASLQAGQVTFAPRIHLKNGTSSNWAGYASLTNLTNPQNMSVSDVRGSWVIPTLSCDATTTYSSAWVGIDGYSDNTVEQTGTEHDCYQGKSYYSAWYEMYPKPSMRIPLALKAGDMMTAQVTYRGANQFRLTLTNNTTGQTFVTNQKSKALRTSAEWIVEAPWSGGVLPLTNFGTMQISNAHATINNHSGSINDPLWQVDPITMTTDTGTPKASPSALSPDGTGFTITWGHN